MQLFDSHCHLDFEAFDSDREEMLERARSRRISRFMLLGVYQQQWQRLIDVAGSVDGALFALGLHPYFIDRHSLADIERLQQQVMDCKGHEKFRAIGEIGLDQECDNMELQIELLREQLRLAKSHHLPVILHHRKTLDKTLKLARESGPDTGVVHAFSGSYEQGKAWVDHGYSLGVGGTITYPRAKKTRDAIARLPLDAMVLETDSPDMPMCGYQGERNEPAYMVNVLDALAELKASDRETVAEQTYQNTLTLFSS